jgi:uncharacterized protein (TIGR00266 family)
MQFKIHYPDTFSFLEIQLQHGESVKAESGAMVTMDETVDIDGKLEGGFMKGLGRMLAGEKFFFQTLKASRGAGTVTLAPVHMGGIVPLELNGATYMIQKDGFLAGSEGVEIDTHMQNMAKGFLSGEGFFIMKVSGKGTVFVNSYGAIHPVDIEAGKTLVIDNQHLVAWPENMTYNIEKASKSGWISSMTSGEGLVCRFHGPGRVYIQTRNPGGFADWIRSVAGTKG